MQGNYSIRRSLTGMKHVTVTFGRSYKIFLAVAAILTLQLLASGQFYGSILIGALLNFFYFISAAARLEAVAQMGTDRAKRVMLIGLLLRLAMVFIVLGVAAHISTNLFLASSVCFATFYLTALGVLIYSERG